MTPQYAILAFVRLVLTMMLIAACGRENLEQLPDHDGDGIVDVYDNCPTKFAPVADDRDGDGVGDACDPHISSAGDEILSFTSFDRELGDWIPDTIDNWSLAAQAVTTAAADTTMARLELDTEASSPTVELSFIVKDYGPSVTRRDNQLFITLALGARIVSCGIANRIEGSALLDTVGANSNFDAVGLFPVVPDTVTELLYTFDGAGTNCIANEGVYSDSITMSAGTSLHAQIIVSHMQVELRSAVVYQSP